MHHYFIVTHSFDHIVDCFCPGDDHSGVLEMRKEDIIEVTNERQFMFDNDWYILVIINNNWQLYMALEDLEKYFTEGYFVSLMDIELKINHLNFQIDQSLGKGDEVAFLQSTTTLKESSELKLILERYLNKVALENQFM